MKEEIIEQIKNQSRAFFGGPDTDATPENIKDFISRMKRFYPEYNLDEDELFCIIEELHTITIKDLNILSDNADHIDWFNDSTNLGIKRDIVWHFWEHFKSYLLFQKNL